MSLFDELPHLCDICGPPTAPRDTAGGTNPTWGTVRVSNVPCQILVASASEQDRFAQLGISISHVLAFTDTATGIQRGDKVVITSPSEVSGIALHVHGIQTQPGVGGIDTFTRVYGEQWL